MVVIGHCFYSIEYLRCGRYEHMVHDLFGKLKRVKVDDIWTIPHSLIFICNESRAIYKKLRKHLPGLCLWKGSGTDHVHMHHSIFSDQQRCGFLPFSYLALPSNLSIMIFLPVWLSQHRATYQFELSCDPCIASSVYTTFLLECGKNHEATHL